ncbi:MAG: glycosyltransferase [Candidatus Magasanikbacteria bacterium]|nr:glycosyltransferase [Candidatus Magasanikbacteria bacterium]
MKIAMVGQKGIPANYGGVERHVHDLSRGLADRGFNVSVYSRQWYVKSDAREYKGVNIIYTPSIHTKHFDAISHTFISTIHAIINKFDIIHYHGVGPSLLSWIPRIFSPKTKVITTFHSIDRYHQKWGVIARYFLRLGEWTACRFAHKTIAVSQSLKQYCQNEFNTDTRYIPNGVKLCNKELRFDKIIDFGLKNNEYLVMISRLVPHKGAHILVEAFNSIKKKYSDDPKISKLKLAIVGGSVYTNDYVTSLHQQANVNNDIVFTDFQSGETLRQLYKNAMALVHPSLNEGLPITVLEAMRYAKPSLVSNIPEHLELIQDNRMICNENDVRSLEEKLIEFIKLPQEEKELIGSKNLQIIKKEYSWDVIIPQIVRTYHESYIEKNEKIANVAA